MCTHSLDVVPFLFLSFFSNAQIGSKIHYVTVSYLVSFSSPPVNYYPLKHTEAGIGHAKHIWKFFFIIFCRIKTIHNVMPEKFLLLHCWIPNSKSFHNRKMSLNNEMTFNFYFPSLSHLISSSLLSSIFLFCQPAL